MEKERKRISLATYIISLLIMMFIIVIIICMLAKGDTKQYNMENTVDDIVQENSNKIISNIKYIEVQIEDTDAQGLEHKEPVRIDDKNVISKLEEIVNSGTEYKPKSTAWPDISPMVTIYLENGEKYVGYTATFLDDGQEERGNYITIFNDKNNEEKVTYKVQVDIETYLTQLYNDNKKINNTEELSDITKAALESFISKFYYVQNSESFAEKDLNSTDEYITQWPFIDGDVEQYYGYLTEVSNIKDLGNNQFEITALQVAYNLQKGVGEEFGKLNICLASDHTEETVISKMSNKDMNLYKANNGKKCIEKIKEFAEKNSLGYRTFTVEILENSDNFYNGKFELISIK